MCSLGAIGVQWNDVKFIVKSLLKQLIEGEKPLML